MKQTKLLAKLNLTEKDLDEIKEAVVRAEQETTGEIALAAVGESDDYSFYELFAAVIAAVLAFAVLLPFHGPVSRWIDGLVWDFSPWLVTAFFGVVSFALMAAVFLLFNIPALDRLIIPPKARSESVYSRAARYFVESGVYATRENNGILLFISLMEHEVHVIADSGILSKTDSPELSVIAANLAGGIKNGTVKQSLLEAVRSCGEILIREFPAKDKNTNVLADGLVLLEK
ncbi:TPM domain-containing protein [Breznakiella homolactica]|uniref:TPM domain-containing protein n=1 Tax=Breznakiella homolactica TaxID=2798577 RepID=A0A7T8BAD8_9SPIR|nr:hypothetical protein [Breznakiella homolactica]QQO08915.1 hypothetical protein JFL75_18590 [Breznakiella homolactica]